jgi:hypothetical protein
VTTAKKLNDIHITQDCGPRINAADAEMAGISASAETIRREFRSRPAIAACLDFSLCLERVEL